MSYGVASQVKKYTPEGYDSSKPLIPHGMSVILNAPAVFRFTAPAAIERHRTAAKVLGAENADQAKDDKVGDLVADRIINLMSTVKFPGGLRQVGFTESDVKNNSPLFLCL